MKLYAKTALVSAAACAVPVYLSYRFFQGACLRKPQGYSKKEHVSNDPYVQVRREAKERLQKVTGEDLWITSEDGLRLHALWLENADAERIIICVHGYRGTYSGNFGVPYDFLKDTCSFLMIDARTRGQSEGTYITYGAKEKDDVYLWLQKVLEITEDLPVYLYGVSMGSSTVLMNTARQKHERFKGVIADCGYTDMQTIITEVMEKDYHLPPFPLIPLIGCWCRLLAHFRMEDADALAVLRNANVPVLFLHGLKDNYVTVHHTIENSAVCASVHNTVLFENAGHGACAASDPKRYSEAMHAFFTEQEKGG
ncbi:MAG: alpha/beta hydrolase [Solobacterium sp.]|nr:alpha/beta hydrolase [Solobacterium sp.]